MKRTRLRSCYQQPFDGRLPSTPKTNLCRLVEQSLEALPLYQRAPLNIGYFAWRNESLDMLCVCFPNLPLLSVIDIGLHKIV